MNGGLAVARYTLLELSRRRILLVFFIIGALGIVAVGVGLKLIYTVSSGQGSFGGPNVDPAVFNHFLEILFVSYVFEALAVFALLVAYGIGMTTIYHDLDSGAAVSIFSKPVSRLAYTAGKISAAVAALVVIVGVLAIEARLVMFLFGGGLENALTSEVVYSVANTLVVMLIVLALSTWMNNIVAAIVTFVYYNVIAGVLVYVYDLANSGVIGNGFLKTVFEMTYWLVPHPLVSSAVGDLVKAGSALSTRPGAGSAVAGIPSASGTGDLVWWAFMVVLFSGLVYYSVRRRQV